MPRPKGPGTENCFLTLVTWAFVAFLWGAFLLPNLAEPAPAFLYNMKKTGCLKIAFPEHRRCRPIAGYNVCNYGRGYVQLTWKSNYETASRALSANFVRHPDLAMQPENAACIMFQGMKDGWFTGKAFEDYLNEQQRDYWNARRIINGTDRAGEIAGYALKFEAALDAAHRPVPESRSTPTSETRQHWLIRIVLAVWEALKP